MEKIKEKPALGERVKEKAVSAPKELLRKVLDDGSERLRAQLRDTSQQGRRDEYGGDAIEDTAASGLHRAEKELLKQRKKKNTEQSASPQGDASAPSSNSDVPPAIRTRETDAARARAPSPPVREQARQAAMKQAVKTKNAYISTQRKTVMTAAPEPQRQGQQAFIQEQGRKASRQQAQRRRAERRFQRQDDLRGDSLCSEGFEPTSRGRIKERGGIQPPKKRQFPEPKTPNHAAGIVPKAREGSKSAVLSSEQAMHSTTVHATAAGTHVAREAAMQMAKRQQMTKAAETATQKTAQAAGRALRAIIAAAQSLLAAIAAGGSTVVAMVLVICLIGLLIVSPFGIFFSGEDSGTGYTMPDAVSIQGSFFEGLKKRAEALEVGEGLHIIQTFEPHPLYAVMEGLGYEHHTEQRSEAEFHVWFCRTEKKEGDSSAPFKPLALLNYPMIDEKLGQIAVDFWETTWQSEKRVLPYETRLLLSLTNAVGAGRMRQAARELVKAYIHGVESAALDDVFELLAWNQGIGFFSSEIGPSALFQAYKLIKNGEKQGKSREDICNMLREKFGEKNPEMQVLN